MQDIIQITVQYNMDTKLFILQSAILLILKFFFLNVNRIICILLKYFILFAWQ